MKLWNGWTLEFFHWDSETEFLGEGSNRSLPIFDVNWYRYTSPRTSYGKLTGVADFGFNFWVVLFRRKFLLTVEKKIPWTKEDMKRYWEKRKA